METFTKEAGSEIKPMGKVNTFMLKEPLIKVAGTKTNKKAMEKKSGQMVHFIMDSTSEVKNMEEVFFNGLMALNLKETGKTIKCMAKVFLSGLMVEFIMVNM
jgi:hypothetical protein